MIDKKEEDRTEFREQPEETQGKIVFKRSPCLTVLNGDKIGKVYKLQEETTVLGRGSDTDLIFPYSSISRRQMMFVKTGEKYYVSDLDSTNGTYVNRERIIHPVLLFEGDKISAGELTFKFSLHDQDDTEYQTKLRSLAVKDGLTGVFNKRYFMDYISREFDFSRRNKSVMSLIFFDIDHFKLLNDTYGHPAGDQVLVQLTKQVGEMGRAYDIFARYGGEEFVILLRGIDIHQSYVLAERIRKTVEDTTYEVEDYRIQFTLSLGISIYEGNDKYDGIGQFIQAADTQLYRAKQRGRNTVCYEDQ